MSTFVNQPRDDDGKWSAGGGLDHGVLNIPLSKRGDIDSQIDKYKAGQARIAAVEAKSVAQQKKEDKATAKQLLAEHGPAILDKHGPKFGRKELAGIMDQWAKWEPRKLIGFVAKFQSEQPK